MENQKTGFIPLYRSVLKKPWAKDVFLRTLWENLLLGAARQPYTANFKGRQWPLQTGQLVTTTADLGLKLCDREGKPSSRHAVDRMLDVFEREGMISRSGEKRKGTVITITNYEQYAQKIDDLPAQFPAHNGEHFTAHDEASNGAACEGHAAHLPAHKTAQ
ncbi:TPA: replication protein, partial [Enterobacter hormaechei subsp. xiangfangensis]|nr:replication protein [Enterobacter hormaechei subsp. xiangfangensis]